jgi:hypothetical protein
MKPDELLIVLIHNCENVIPSRNVADRLRSKLNGAGLLEVFIQEEFSEETLFHRLVRHLFLQFRLEDLWREYLGKQSRISRIKAEINIVRKIAMLSVVASYRKREWRIREIECAVSRKHQLAWGHFQQSDAKLLLVLESDAAWIDGVSEKIPELLQLLETDSPAYLNLAGGLRFDELGVQLLMEAPDGADYEKIKTFAKPVTNTSCAYAVNRSLANAFMSHTRDFPAHKTLGIDWLINGVFLELTRRGQVVTCTHSWPPILLHGSMAGISESWHPGRN